MAQLRERGLLDDGRIAAAFGRVERHLFVPGHTLQSAYSDEALVTRERDGVPASSSSQPAIMAAMLAQLDVREGQRVLEVGAGTGYNAALLSELAGPGGRVTTVDVDPATARAAGEHLARAGHGGVRVLAADGARGAAQDAPFDRIVVTAGCWAIPPAWSEQLAGGGRLVLPLRVNATELSVALHREGDVLRGRGAQPCGFMPLQGGEDAATAWAGSAGWRASADVGLDDEHRATLDRPGHPGGASARGPARGARAPARRAAVAVAARSPAREARPAGRPRHVGLARRGRPARLPARLRHGATQRARQRGAAARRSRGAGGHAGRPRALGAGGPAGNDALWIEARPAASGAGAGPLPRPFDGGYAFDRGGRRFELRFAPGPR